MPQKTAEGRREYLRRYRAGEFKPRKMVEPDAEFMGRWYQWIDTMPKRHWFSEHADYIAAVKAHVAREPKM